MTHPYASEAYARAFGGSYLPVHLPSTDIWMLSRPIPGTDRRDAMGCYPRCPLPGGADLTSDFASLAAQGLVSVVLVTDVFFHLSKGELERQFDYVRPYKTHFTYGFSLEANENEPIADQIQYRKHHRDRVRWALRSCETRVIDLADHLDDWFALYRTLIERHRITGVQSFSRDYFAALAAMPGLTTIGAFADDKLVSAHLWLEYSGFAYSHLAASSAEGYAMRAAYPIYDAALRLYAGRVAAVDLGAGAGLNEAATGLTEFKGGFANSQRQCFIAGKILDPRGYRELCGRGEAPVNFFPAYRGNG